MWFYVFRFFSCKVSVNAFSFLYSKLLRARLRLFVFSATFAEWHWQFISICSCFIRILDLDEFLLIRGLFLFFLIAFSRAPFCRVLASACEA